MLRLLAMRACYTSATAPPQAGVKKRRTIIPPCYLPDIG